MKKFLIIFCCALSVLAYGAPKALVSVPPYAYLVEKIAGGTVEVQTVVPPGANAHLYEPSPRDVEKMQEVAVWMRLGEPNEEKLMRALKEKNNNLVIVELWKEAPLLDGCCRGEADLHFWLNPKLASNQAEKMAQALCTLFPEHKEIYLKNLKALQQELANLDKEIAERLAPLQGQAILASHPAFGYFCKEYGLIQLSIECEGKEPRPKQIAALLQQAKAAHVRVVLTQAQYSNKGAELVAKKLALPTTLVDPYSKDYVNNLLHLAEVIAHDN